MRKMQLTQFSYPDHLAGQRIRAGRKEIVSLHFKASASHPALLPASFPAPARDDEASA